MSKPSRKWWGYVKEIIRAYPAIKRREVHGIEQCEKDAVQAAVDATDRMKNGSDRLKVVDLVLWSRSHTIDGAALQISCSPRTAQQYHADFVREVARNFRCNGLMDGESAGGFARGGEGVGEE